MEFSLNKSLEILERTPIVLSYLLDGISPDWTSNNEGGDTWSVYDVIGHLVHGEKTDWIARLKKVLAESGDKKFTPFDRFAQFQSSKGKTLHQLLQEFTDLRKENMKTLRSLNITEKDMGKTGIHPTFGEVALSQLLSTWTVHDLDHLSQISRVMAKQYKEQVGPWVEFLKILKAS